MNLSERITAINEWAILQSPSIYQVVKDSGILDMRVRGFEKCPISETSMATVVLPRRETRKSAGYDIRTNEDVLLIPGQMYVIHTGITAYMQDDEYLDIRIRSGLAYNHCLTLQNDAGVIDSDYYGKEIKIMIRNEGVGTVYFKVGDRIAQGIFSKYLVTDDDMPSEKERAGGTGSTGVN